MSTFILPLDAPQATLDVAGGKGANLSRLTRAGFPVPAGFVVTTAAYRAFVEANHLADDVAAACRELDASQPASFDSASEAIRARFDAGTLPADLAAEIVRAYRALAPAAADATGPAVAVRSSATAEDLPEASFAGQQETYLNVRGEAGLLRAVQRCWSSLWTARALAYRARQGIDPSSVSLAVVVQQLVPADASGVLFTVDPLSGARDVVVIDVAWGLGEAIVSGQVTPDTVVVDKATGAVRQLTVGDKAVMTAALADGTAEVPVPAERRTQPALSPAQAAQLAALGRAIEAALGGPQDVEWAIAGGEAYVLQARPVTALPPPAADPLAAVPGDDAWPARGEQPVRPFDLWSQSDMGERWPEPVTPLTWSIQPLVTAAYTRYSFRDVQAPYLATTQWAKRYFGRVYMNEGAMAYTCSREYGLPSSYVAGAMGSAVSPALLPQEPARPLRMLRRLPGWLRQMGERLRNERRYQALFPRIDGWVDAFMRRDLAPLSDPALLDELERVWNPRFAEVINLHADASTSAMMALPMLESVLQRWCGRKEVAHALLTGIAGLHTAEMVPALVRMAATARDLGLDALILDTPADEALARLRAAPAAAPLLVQLDAFLQRHGHRCATEAEFLYPRWAEAPGQVLETLASYLRAPSDVDPMQAEARQRRQRAATQAKVERRLDPLRRTIFRKLLARTEHVVRLRDNGQSYLVKLMLPIRHLYAELGRRWAARGWLAAADDVFFLADFEIAAIVRAGAPAALDRPLPALVSARREAYRYWSTVRAPEVVDRAGQPVTAPLADDGALVGIAASGGRVQGRARVIATLQEATRLQPGDILVTRATDPGWTPVFPLVGGLVLEIGGQLSHGAVVAREYGLPAVVNVPEATSRIADGQHVTVDGSTGRVYLGTTPTTGEAPTRAVAIV